jgi:hypothetical protein
LLLLLGAVALFDRFGSADTARNAASAGALDPAPTSAPVPTKPDTAATASAAEREPKPSRCPGTNPYRVPVAAGRTDPPSKPDSTVDSVWLAWRSCPGLVVVEGHVEKGGDTRDASNMAIAMAERLALKGIPEGTLTWTGKGATTPLAGRDPTDTANRRIEIYLMEPYHPGLR